MSAAVTIIERIERLARISAYPWNLTRRIFSPAQAEAEALVLGWMQEAGLSTRRDPIGNLIGRVEGSIPVVRPSSSAGTSTRARMPAATTAPSAY